MIAHTVFRLQALEASKDGGCAKGVSMRSTLTALAAVTLGACASVDYAPGDEARVVLPNLTAQQALAALTAVCSAHGMAIEDKGRATLTCRTEPGGLSNLASQVLLMNVETSPTRLYFRFHLDQTPGGVIISGTEWVYYRLALAQEHLTELSDKGSRARVQRLLREVPG
jgi:hypothetical protein